MSETIDVEITGVGRIRGGQVSLDATVRARCAMCGSDVEAGVAIGASSFGCAPCLRARLDALSVGRFRLRGGESSGLPWGKISG